LQPHLREQHPLQLPPQGAGDAPQEGGPPPRPGRNRAGRGLVLALSYSTPRRRRTRDGCTFFSVRIISVLYLDSFTPFAI
jgi:hypothetical protein